MVKELNFEEMENLQGGKIYDPLGCIRAYGQLISQLASDYPNQTLIYQYDQVVTQCVRDGLL